MPFTITPRRSALALALACAGVLPASASAGVITTNSGQLTYSDPDNLSSTITIERLELTNAATHASRYRVRESGPGVSLRTGGTCFPANTNEAICSDVVGQSVVLGGGGDRLTLTDRAAVAVEDPAVGLIQGGPGGDVIVTGDGIQRIDGQGEDDVIDAGAGADDIRGGSGRDTVLYTTRMEPVLVGGNAPTLGARNEGDTWDDQIEEIGGGAGADTLAVAAPGRGVGPKRLAGNGGRDVLYGGFETSFRADAGDVLEGGAEDDTLVARDGQPDKLRCGAGTDDVAIADLRDEVPEECERKDRAPLTAGPNVQIAATARARAGKALLRLTCPRSQRLSGAAAADTRTKPCAGTVRAGARSVRFRVALGRTATVAVALSAADRRKIAGRRRVTRTAVAVERVHPKGPNTTARPVAISR